MLFSAYLAMLFVSGHVHGGYIAGMGIQVENHGTETLKESPSTDTVESITGKTTRQLGGKGASASSLAPDASSVKTSRMVRRDEHVLFDRLSLRLNENAAEIRSGEPEQVRFTRDETAASRKPADMDGIDSATPSHKSHLTCLHLLPHSY